MLRDGDKDGDLLANPMRRLDLNIQDNRKILCKILIQKQLMRLEVTLLVEMGLLLTHERVIMCKRLSQTKARRETRRDARGGDAAHCRF